MPFVVVTGGSGKAGRAVVRDLVEHGRRVLSVDRQRSPDLPCEQIAGQDRRVILGIRPTDFQHGETAEPGLPRVTVRPDVVEDIGSESHLIFTVDAPRVTADAVRAATEAAADEGKLFADDQRTVFTACLDARREVASGVNVELAVDCNRFHFFDPATGDALDAAPQV